MQTLLLQYQKLFPLKTSLRGSRGKLTETEFGGRAILFMKMVLRSIPCVLLCDMEKGRMDAYMFFFEINSNYL